MGLLGRAGEQHGRAGAGPGTDREGGEAATDQVAGEVLVGDVEVTCLPPASHVCHEGQQDVADGALDRHGAQEAVEHLVHGADVVGEHRSLELGERTHHVERAVG